MIMPEPVQMQLRPDRWRVQPAEGEVHLTCLITDDCEFDQAVFSVERDEPNWWPSLGALLRTAALHEAEDHAL
jgi:hypothetical protein